MSFFDPKTNERLIGQKVEIVKKLDDCYWLCKGKLDGNQIYLFAHIPLVSKERDALVMEYVLNPTRCDYISKCSFEIYSS